MNLFDPSAFAGILSASPALALLAAAAVGVATSIGPCTFLRAATLFGLVGERPEKRQGLQVAAAFVGGLIVSYIGLGLLVTYVTGFKSASRVVYPLTGVLLLILGLSMARLIRLPKRRGPKFVYELRSRLSSKVSGLSSFALGGTFAFMVCPCCLPVLLAIYAFAFAGGQLPLGILLIVVFTVAHSIPLLAVGYFGHLAKRLAKARRFESDLNFLLGVIVFVTGLVVLWIA